MRRAIYEDDVIKLLDKGWKSGVYPVASNIHALPSAQPDNQTNLCDSCDYSYPDCPSKNDDVIFGNGIGNDNICACNKYKPSVQPELTDVQAIEHLQESGWMQNHDKQMYEMGLREQLADDSDSYDALLPSAQPERQKGKWIDHTEDGYVECPFCHSATNCDGNKDELHFCFSCGSDMRGEQDESN